MDDLVIGIDLGTTNSCVSLFIDGRSRVLENSDGGRITPSFIFFSDTEEIIVGEHAKRLASSKPDHGIYEVKRLIGHKFRDFDLRTLKYIPFILVSDDNNQPVIVLQHRKKVIKKTPEELCTLILEKLKRDVETKLGKRIQNVVITVPAYFNVIQREVTLAAAKKAGFKVLKLLNEPTAAALNYYFENDCPGTHFSLVFDLGGGTLDVAILKKTSSKIEILSVDGDTQLGGNDFSKVLINHVCEELIRHYAYDPQLNKNNLKRLWHKCEDAKKALSTVSRTVMTLTGFVDNNPNIQIILTRKKFEHLADRMFQRAMEIVDKCVKASGISKERIKDVILSGGSTRIPKLQSLLSDYFNGKTLNRCVNPDECVAEGAALQAAMLSKNPKQKITKISLKDVVPLSLGTAVLGGEMSFIIQRNSPIPTSETAPFLTVYNNQEFIEFELFEGERTDVKKNRHLGTLTIHNLTLAPPGECLVDLTMHVDENGILTVTAKECLKNIVKELKVEYVRGSKSENEIKSIVSDADNHKKDDQVFKELARHRSYLIAYCVTIIFNLEKAGLVKTHRDVYDFCKNAEKIAGYENENNLEGIKKLVKTVKEKCEPLVACYDFRMSEL